MLLRISSPHFGASIFNQNSFSSSVQRSKLSKVSNSFLQIHMFPKLNLCGSLQQILQAKTTETSWFGKNFRIIIDVSNFHCCSVQGYPQKQLLNRSYNIIILQFFFSSNYYLQLSKHKKCNYFKYFPISSYTRSWTIKRLRIWNGSERWRPSPSHKDIGRGCSGNEKVLKLHKSLRFTNFSTKIFE